MERKGINVEVADLTNKEHELGSALQHHRGSTLWYYCNHASISPCPAHSQNSASAESTSRIVIGGAHPSSLPDRCLQDGFDFVVTGEGEEAMIQLVANMKMEVCHLA